MLTTLRHTFTVVAALVAALVAANVPCYAQESFLRGDANSDGVVSISDEVTIQRHLFAGGLLTGCRDAADTDDDGVVNIRDQIQIVRMLADPMTDGWNLTLPEPYPLPGVDPTDDDVDCALYEVSPAATSESDTVTLGDVTAAPGEEVEIPILLSNTIDVDAIQLVLSYDPDLLTPIVGRGPVGSGGGVSLGAYYDQFETHESFHPIAMLNSHPTEGVFTVVFVGTIALPGFEVTPGTDTHVGTFRARVSPDVTPGTVITVSAVESPAGPHGMRNELTSKGEASYVSVVPTVIATGINIVAESFMRGDSNGDLRLDIADALRSLGFLFLDGEPLACPDAADTNDDGKLDLTDPVGALNTLFGTGPELPGLGACTVDATPDELGPCDGECPAS